jgi:hypothetical protein
VSRKEAEVVLASLLLDEPDLIGQVWVEAVERGEVSLN